MTTTRCLPSELTIYTVGETHPVCLGWLDAGSDDPLQVDAAAVYEIDAAGVQMLLALANGLGRQERRLQLLNASPALAAACDAMGAQALMANAEPTGAAA